MKSRIVALLACICLMFASGCTFAVTGVRGSLFKKESAEGEKTAALARSTAKTLLLSGRAVPDVEQIVLATGVDAAAAKRIVAEVLAEIVLDK